jgi:hypothetical protein
LKDIIITFIFSLYVLIFYFSILFWFI